MATVLNIEDTHKGENLVIRLLAKDPDGTVLSSPLTQTITFTVSKTEGGEPFLAISNAPAVILANAGTGEWLLDIPAAQLSGLGEDRAYHYNIWSSDGNRPWLQAKGRFKRLASIEPEA